MAKPSGHKAHGSLQAAGEVVVSVESDGFAQHTAGITEMVSAAVFLSFRRAELPSYERHARFALMENEHRPCALANDEVTFPMTAIGSGGDILGPRFA